MKLASLLERIGGIVALALAIVDRLHHHVRYALSPSYRRVRRRIGEIGKPV